MHQRHAHVPREVLPGLVTRRTLAVFGIRDLDVLLADMMREAALRARAPAAPKS
jgi:hypothetical protein